MDLSSQTHGTVELVTLPARLVMANARQTRLAIKALVDGGRTRLVLDLQNVEFIDSSGLSVLVSTMQVVQQRDGKVVLLSPSSGVRSLIELTRLHQIFEIFEDREAAIYDLNEHQVTP
ncbi:MAG: anti-sigma B factor antagonist [Gammaproteobacteria bacterium]|jgi:anti-sigma B factor antagonist